MNDFYLNKTFSDLSSDLLVNKVRANMDEARFRHCQGVSITARKLAKLNNYDEDKAALAGFIHDLSLIHISEPTRHTGGSRMPSSA